MTALVLVIALLLDAVLGEPRWLWARVPHPAVLMGRAIAVLDLRFNRGSARRTKGVLCLASLLGVSAGAGWLVSLGGGLAEILLAAILVAQRSLVDHVRDVGRALARSVQDGRAAVALIVSRDTCYMNESQIARAAIESAAENLSDGVIAPAFWFLLGGAPGLVVYKMVNTADSMIGYRTPRHHAFGWAAARLDDLMNLIPARLTALLIALVGGVTALGAIRRDAGQHRSPNAGWPEAAMAHALGIALSGPRAYDGEMRDFPWVNAAGRRDLTASDIDETVTMLWKVWGLFLLICAGLGAVTL